jgi:hypothetical protein
MSRNQSLIRTDYPNPHRLGGTLLFREALGDIGSSTFARYLKLGLIPPPDKKVGPLNMWFEPHIAATVAALPSGRGSNSSANVGQAAAAA